MLIKTAHLCTKRISSFKRDRGKKKKKRSLIVRHTEATKFKILSCTDQKCNRERQAVRVFQSLWACINLKSCYIKEKYVWERLPHVTLNQICSCDQDVHFAGLRNILKILPNASGKERAESWLISAVSKICRVRIYLHSVKPITKIKTY